MNSKTIVRIAFCGMFAALVYVATSIIGFNIPGGGGYIHFGDSIVILTAMLLGPIYGAVAAALGSALADLTSPYAYYAIFTAVVKGALAFSVGLAYRKMSGEAKKVNNATTQMIYHAVVSYLVVVGGYFITELIIAGPLGYAGTEDSIIALAIGTIIPNSLQVGFGIITSQALYQLLKRPFEDIYRG